VALIATDHLRCLGDAEEDDEDRELQEVVVIGHELNRLALLDGLADD
jgi:hypothetical protein